MTNLLIRDVSLFVKVMGQGYPILLMHGGPSLDYTTLLPLQPLAEQFTLIFYDHRCNGQSDGALSSMTWENLTADADALRQSLGFERWAVLGHSFGGMVALEYALRYPLQLSHLILMDTCGDADATQQHAPELLAKRGYSDEAVQAVRRFFGGQITSGEYLPTVWKFLSAYAYHPSLIYHPGILALAHRAHLDPPMKIRPETFIYAQGHLINGWTVMRRLGEIKAPTLVVAGRHDFLFPPEHQAILADRIPHAQLEIIECAGHNPQMERTTDVLQVIKRFMNDATHAGTERVHAANRLAPSESATC